MWRAPARCVPPAPPGLCPGPGSVNEIRLIMWAHIEAHWDRDTASVTAVAAPATAGSGRVDLGIMSNFWHDVRGYTDAQFCGRLEAARTYLRASAHTHQHTGVAAGLGPMRWRPRRAASETPVSRAGGTPGWLLNLRSGTWAVNLLSRMASSVHTLQVCKLSECPVASDDRPKATFFPPFSDFCFSHFF